MTQTGFQHSDSGLCSQPYVPQYQDATKARKFPYLQVLHSWLLKFPGRKRLKLFLVCRRG